MRQNGFARVAAELVSLGVAAAGVAVAVFALEAWWLAAVAGLFLGLDLGERLLRQLQHTPDTLGPLTSSSAAQRLEVGRRPQVLGALVGGGEGGAGVVPAKSRRDGDRILGPCGASSCASVHRCSVAHSECSVKTRRHHESQVQS